MNKRIAALDLGTNTFHLLIAELVDGKLHKIIEEQRHAKLGEGGINKGIIADAAYQRGIKALKYFRSVIDKNPVSVIKASGTAALRTAKNGADFIAEVKKETGIEIEVIAGDKEAELIYRGIRAATDLGSSSLIMDIGGGSVEFIFCNNERIFWKKSYPVGAAKLMSAFHHSDPISSDDIEAVKGHLSAELAELAQRAAEFKPFQLVGSAGAFETFAALETQEFGKPQEALNSDSYSYSLNQLKAVLNKIINSAHNERAANNLIIPVRTDMIVVASVLTQYIMKTLNIQQVVMSRYSLKEGLLLEAFG